MLRHRTTINAMITFLLIDQITKTMFFDRERLSGLFHPVINTGAARSMPISEAVIITVAIVISGRLIHMYTKNEINTYIAALFFAGIWGNIIDRIFYPGVRDFIWIGDRWPIFNIADSYLTIAVIALIRHEYRTKTNP